STDGGYIGDDIYEYPTPSAAQTKGQSAQNYVVVTYHLKIENDGNEPDTITVTGTAGGSGWSVTYYDALSGGTDITTEGTGSGAGWNLAAAGTKEIRVEISADGSINAGQTKELLIYLVSDNDGSKQDVLKAVTTIAASYQPDSFIKNFIEAAGAYIAEDINEDGTGQTKAQSVYTNETASYHIRITNDGNASDSFSVTGTAGGSGWTVKYFNSETGGIEITAAVTGGGWPTPGVLVTESYIIRLEVSPDPTVPATDTINIYVRARSSNDNTKADTVKAVTTALATVRVDNEIKSNLIGDTYIGDEIFNLDGTNQTGSRKAENDEWITYYIRINNDGNGSETFTVTGTGGGSGWSVSYYNALSGGTNITVDVTGDGWSGGPVGAGNSIEIRVEIMPDSGVPVGNTLDTLITSISNDGTKKDCVKAASEVVDAYQPDSHIKLSSEAVGGYLGDDEYNLDGTNQTKNQNHDYGTPAVYHIRLENDGAGADSFTVSATAGSSGWTVVYYDDPAGGNNITADVTGSNGWSTTNKVANIATGSNIEIRVEISGDLTIAAGAVKDLYITSLSQGNIAKRDTVKASTTMNPYYLADFQIKLPADGTYIGNDVYNLDATGQAKSQDVANLDTVTYHLRIQNDGNTDDSFTITGASGGAGWIVTYYDALSGGTNITGDVTGSGWFAGPLSKTNYTDFRVEVYADDTLAGGAQKQFLIYATTSLGSDTVQTTSTVTNDYLVDSLVRNEGEGVYTGDGTYNQTGAGQSKGQTAANNIEVTYYIKIENDGNSPDTISVSGTAGGAGWTVTYYDDSTQTNITANVTGNGWTFNPNPGENEIIKLLVSPDNSLTAGDELDIYVSGTSQNSPAQKDIVKTTTIVGTAYQLDLQIKGDTDPNYLGDDIRNLDATNQIKSRGILAGQTTTYYIRYENDGNTGDNFTISGTAGDADWTVKYFDALSGGNDITASVTDGTGWQPINPIPKGATKDILLSITADPALALNETKDIYIMAISNGDVAKQDVVKAVVTVTSTQIILPVGAKQVGPQPVLIGIGPVGQTVTVKDETDTVVGTGVIDANGNYRVKLDVNLSAGNHTLTPWTGGIEGISSNIEVVDTPTNSQVPVITEPAQNAIVKGVVKIRGNAGAINAGKIVTAHVNIEPKGATVELDFNAITTTVQADGTFAMDLSVGGGDRHISIECDGVVSQILHVQAVDPYGIIFDSRTNQPIDGARVTLYVWSGGAWKVAVVGVDILDPSGVANPQPSGIQPGMTLNPGGYQYDVIPGTYRLKVDGGSGYIFPSTIAYGKVEMPAGVAQNPEISRGVSFVVGASIWNIDLPMDATDNLLKVTKKVNKKEVTIGDILTYEITVENEHAYTVGSATSPVYIQDILPPGFKYIEDSTMMKVGGATKFTKAATEPAGGRYRMFNIG
ncbi:MAG: DUF11 domain-containing protein, partial [Planctomycetes bacterium]|nr:DUF11 domain-containing protein [Planctomycetota bacterium]